MENEDKKNGIVIIISSIFLSVLITLILISCFIGGNGLFGGRTFAENDNSLRVVNEGFGLDNHMGYGYGYGGSYIDMKTINTDNSGTTTLYTVPSGKKLFIMGAVQKIVSSTGISTSSIISIGSSASPSFNDIMDTSFSLSASTSVTSTESVNFMGLASRQGLFNSGEKIIADIVEPATGTASTSHQEILIDILGYLY